MKDPAEGKQNISDIKCQILVESFHVDLEN